MNDSQRIRRRLVATSIALVCAVIVSTARADYWQFRPTATLSAEYQDNVGLVPDDQSGDRENDVSIGLLPSLALLYNTYQTQFLIRLSGMWRYYFLNDENNTDSYLDHLQLDLEYNQWITQRLQLRAANSISYFLDVRATDTEAVVLPRQESIYDTFSLSFLHQAAIHTEMEYSAQVITSEFEDDGVDDYIQYAPAISFRQHVEPAFVVEVFASFRRVLFDPRFDFFRRAYDEDFQDLKNKPSGVAFAHNRDGLSRWPWDLRREEDYDLYTAGVGGTYRLTPTFSVTVRGGALVPVHMVEGIYKTANLDWFQFVSLEKTFARMRIDAQYQRDIAPTQGLTDTVLNQGVRLALTRRWLEDFRTIFAGNYGRFESVDGDIDQFRGEVDTYYLVLKWLGLGLRYEYTDQQSEFGDTRSRITDHRVVLTVSLVPPRPDALRF